MKLLEQLLKEMGADTLKSFTVVPGFGGYFRSVKCILSFSPQKIVIRLNRECITVEGENLQVGSYFEHDIFIRGAIKAVGIE